VPRGNLDRSKGGVEAKAHAAERKTSVDEQIGFVPETLPILANA
jgi:hypothetical protein